MSKAGLQPGMVRVADSARFVRSYPLDDIEIVTRSKGGDGRTVDAYAAVFDRAVPIRDHQGEYLERIARGAFKRTIDNRGTNFGVFYNHARTIHGESSDRWSLPIGTPLIVREDSKGVFTRTRYEAGDDVDQLLARIKSNAIRGQSFSGRFVRSDPSEMPRYGFQPDERGELVTVTRTEVDMIEYGPTPFPAYNEAAILGVRALLADVLTPDQLAHILSIPTRDDGPEDGRHSAQADPAAAADSPNGGHSERQQWTPEQIARRERLLGRE